MAAVELNLIPIQSTRHERFTDSGRDLNLHGYHAYCVSLSSSGNIAMSCRNESGRNYIDLYSTFDSNSAGIPTLSYSMRFKQLSRGGDYRYVAFLRSDSCKIVTCSNKLIEICDPMNNSKVLRSRVLNGTVRCLVVREEEGEIFVGVFNSHDVLVLNHDLQKTKKIVLKDIDDSDYPWDMTVTKEKLFVCIAGMNNRALSFRESDGVISREFTSTLPKYKRARSIAVSEEIGFVAVLWDHSVFLYPVNDSKPILVVKILAYRIRISDRVGVMLTGNLGGKIAMYDIAELLTYDDMKATVVSLLKREDCVSLLNVIGLKGVQSESILKNYSPSKALFDVLEKDGVIKPSDVDKLADALTNAKTSSSCQLVVDIYRKTRIKKNRVPNASTRSIWTKLRQYLYSRSNIGSKDTPKKRVREDKTEFLGKKREKTKTEIFREKPKTLVTQERRKDKYYVDMHQTLSEQEPERLETELDYTRKTLPTVQSTHEKFIEEIEGLTRELEHIKITLETTRQRSNYEIVRLTKELEETRETLKLSKEESTKEIGALIKELDQPPLLLQESESPTKVLLEPRNEAKCAASFLNPEKAETSVLAVVSNERLLQAVGIITQFEGTLEIPNSGIMLKIPSDALPKDLDKCAVMMRILPSNRFEDPDKSFSSNSSVVVELLPNNVRLRHAVELNLPHCMELTKMENHKANVFISHHSEGDMPRWIEHPDVRYSVEETSCKIWLDKFCWVTIKINDKSVVAKRIVLYTSGRKLKPMDKYAEIQVGYHLDLQVEATFLLLNRFIDVLQKKTFLFMKEGEEPLWVSLKNIISNGWSPSSCQNNPMEISFESIAASIEHQCPFILQKVTDNAEAPLCIFEALQKGGQQPVLLTACLEQVSYTNFNPAFQREAIAVSSVDQSHSINQGTSEYKETRRNDMDHLIQDLAVKIGLEWRKIGRYLDVRDEELDHIETDIGDSQEKNNKMLRQWKQKNGSKATFKVLMDALEMAGRKDLAEYVEIF